MCWKCRCWVSPTRYNQKLTSLDGDPVGTAVGLDEGETEGPFDGDAEGPVLGDDVGGPEGETVRPSCFGHPTIPDE